MVDRSGHAMQTLITTEAERMKAVLDDGISNIRKLCYIGQLRDPELLCFIEKSLAIRSSDDCRGLQGEEKQTSRAIAALNNLWDVEESVLLHGNQQNTLQHKVIILPSISESFFSNITTNRPRRPQLSVFTRCLGS